MYDGFSQGVLSKGTVPVAVGGGGEGAVIVRVLLIVKRVVLERVAPPQHGLGVPQRFIPSPRL